MKTDAKITDEVAAFVEKTAFSDFPSEAIRLAKRCVLDGLGLMFAGSVQDCTRIVREFSRKNSQGSGATAFGIDPVKLPPALAALVNGTAGHAMDWDDTQLSTAAYHPSPWHARPCRSPTPRPSARSDRENPMRRPHPLHRRLGHAQGRTASSLVSSKSSACPAVPFTNAAPVGEK